MDRFFALYDIIHIGTLHHSNEDLARGYPSSDFVVANSLGNGKSWSQMKLTLAKVLARK